MDTISPTVVAIRRQWYDEFGYATLQTANLVALNTLRQAAPLFGSPPDPFYALRKRPHQHEFNPPVVLFLNPSERRQEVYRAFSGWAVHTHADTNAARTGFDLDGLPWQSVEHAYQAAKYIGVNAAWVGEVRAAPRPRDAKVIGRVYAPRPDWEEIKQIAMLRALLATALAHPAVAALLTQTAGAVLVEDSYQDAVWGRGPDFHGQNLLGLTWMLARIILEQQRAAIWLEQTQPLVWYI
ncbi:MAG: hypothetical protein DCC57_18980 [Chloroflexi bacterium]|nr:MAG: hypothetical protein DCC57_18980 [Chloroflexota bacterium]